MINAELAGGFSEEGLKRIDTFLKKEVADNRMPGNVVALTKNGKLVIFEAYGYRNKATNTPMTTNTIFALASMTKVMTTVSALTFYEEAKMPLNASVANWFPQFKTMKLGVLAADGTLTTVPAKKPVTIQDLMRHTNGLTYGGRGATAIHKQFPASSSSSAMDLDGKQFIEKLASAPLLYEPGTAWDYGFGLDVLGLIQEQITGKTLSEVMSERIWSTLGMVDTGFDVAAKDANRFAQPLPNDTLTGKPQNIPILTAKLKYDCGGGCAYGTTFWADPKENMVVVVMAATPGEVRKEYREKINALIYSALEK